MIKSDHRASLVIAYVGYGLQAMGVLPPHNYRPPDWVMALIFLVGTGLLVAGLALGLRAKGRKLWWSLIGLLPVLGIWIGAAVLHSLKDLAPEGRARNMERS